MQNSNPLVSIIMPAYNASKYIEASIQSIIQQTYSNWQLIITDDCSTDDTVKVIQKYIEKDARIQLVQLECNAGPAAARNASLAQARGIYIAFCDSDDLWLFHKLETQIEFMIKNNYAFTYTLFRRFSTEPDLAGDLVSAPKFLTYKKLLKNTAIATSTVIVNRQETGLFQHTKCYYDDFVLWLDLTSRGFNAYLFSDDLMRYRKQHGSVSGNKLKSAKKVWEIYRTTLKFNVIRASWYFSHYSIRGLMKHRKL